MAVSPLLLLTLIVAVQEAPELDKQVDQLVEQLKDLSPDASRAQFLGRPALSKLMALGPRALPRLKHHFLEQQDWRLKASVGYLAILLGHSDPQIRTRWKALCKDPDVFVRVAMISLSEEMATSCVIEMPAMTREERAVFDRIDLSKDLRWMSGEDLKSLAVQALTILKEGKPLVDPPQLEGGGLSGRDNDPKRLRSSGVRLLTPLTKKSKSSLLRVFETPAAHEAMKLVFECAEADDGTDPPRLGLLFRVASLSLAHGGDCRRLDGNSNCPQRPEDQRRLFALCEKWAWKLTEPNAQYGLLSALDYVWLWKAYDLRERLSKEHPDEQVREFAGHNLNRLWNSKYDRGYTREQEAQDDLQVEARKKR